MEALGRFAQLAALPEPSIDLAEAALLIGAAGDPGIEPSRWLAELEGYAARLADLGALRHRLFAELGFRGDTRNYYDPENSFLHRVIARRLGIPITLSVLAIEVGRRADIALEAVGMPGHFLVGVPADSAVTPLDAAVSPKAVSDHPVGGAYMACCTMCATRRSQPCSFPDGQQLWL